MRPEPACTMHQILTELRHRQRGSRWPRDTASRSGTREAKVAQCSRELPELRSGQHRSEQDGKFFVDRPAGLGEVMLAPRREPDEGGPPVVRIRKPPAIAEGPEPVHQLARPAGRHAEPGGKVLHAATLHLRYHGHGLEQNEGQAEPTSEVKIHRGRELEMDLAQVTEYAPQVSHGHSFRCPAANRNVYSIDYASLEAYTSSTDKETWL
jgi:hypothetical protein